MIYITTSRKPSQETRKLARWLEIIFGGESENRGKRGTEEIMARATSKGYSRVLFIHEKNGNPSSLVFLDENDGWLEPEIAVLGVIMPAVKSKRLPGRIKVTPVDKDGERIAGLFNPRELGEETADLVEAKVGGTQIFFEYQGQQVGPKLKIRLLTSGK